MAMFKRSFYALVVLLMAGPIITLSVEAAPAQSKSDVCYFDECLDGDSNGQELEGDEYDRHTRRNRVPRQNDDVWSQPAPFPQLQVAQACYTQAGMCPMGVVLPAGSQCACYTGFGVFPGVAR